MNIPRPKITIDTNSFIYLFDRVGSNSSSFGDLAALVRYSLSGKLEMAVTTRAEGDLANDSNEARRLEMLRFLNLLPIIGTVARWDVSRWDEGDMWVGQPEERLISEIQAILFPGLLETDKRHRNKLYDIDHLTGHKLNSRDIFVTDDMGIWRKRAELKAGPGIVVMKPSECLAYIDEIELRKAPQTFPSDEINPAYHLRLLQGQAQFDYSNNNHSFSIGEGHFYFETKWTKASDTSIHAYSDASSIGALALAKDVVDITDIKDASIYDYSSRVRTSNIGQVVIWRNVNGIYAATKILSIKDDSRGADQDELVFDYLVLDNGSSDFSPQKK